MSEHTETNAMREALQEWVDQGYIDADGEHCGSAAYAPKLYEKSVAALSADLAVTNSHADLVRALEAFMRAMQSRGNWDDGCFYYNGTSASELQTPIELARAALVNEKQFRGGVESRHAGNVTQATGSAVPGVPLCQGDTILPTVLPAAGLAPGPRKQQAGGEET